MIADMLSNEQINPIVAELFIRGRKLNISLNFITRYTFYYSSSFAALTQYFIMKIPNKTKFQQILFNHSSYIDFINIYKKCTAKPYSFLVNDTTFALDSTSRFRKYLLKRIHGYWLLMIRLQMKSYNTILIEKQQTCHHYHQVNFMKMNIL